jgi:hypothetical protein
VKDCFEKIFPDDFREEHEKNGSYIYKGKIFPKKIF